MPWWTTDVGGFMTDDVNDPAFRELLVRWFEFATYTAVLRLHGERGPLDIAPLDDREFGGGYLHTGHENEVWSYGPEVEAIMRKYLTIREDLKPYRCELFAQTSKDGSPLLRALFFEFPNDERAWETYDEFMFGPRYLVAPVLELGARERSVYLPAGTWRDTRNNAEVVGPATIVADAPLDSIPVFELMAR